MLVRKRRDAFMRAPSSVTVGTGWQVMWCEKMKRMWCVIKVRQAGKRRD